MGRKAASVTEMHICKQLKSCIRADTKHLSFERLPNVIRVNKVLHKEVLKCQYMDRYTVTFSKIEHVPVMDDEEEGRSVAKKGQGQTYIDVEVSMLFIVCVYASDPY